MERELPNSCVIHQFRRVATSDFIPAVVARVEQIATEIPDLLRCLQPAIRAVRDGAITKHPNDVFFYLLGALHSARLADDRFFELQDVIDNLRPDMGAEELPLDLLSLGPYDARRPE